MTAAEPYTLTSIIDNQHGNTLHNALDLITENGRELWIATAFFSLDALNMVGENLVRAERIRLLFGDDACARQRNALIRAMQERSDADLLKQRESDPLLNGLRLAKQLIDEGRIEARVYTKGEVSRQALHLASQRLSARIGHCGQRQLHPLRPDPEYRIEYPADRRADGEADRVV